MALEPQHDFWGTISAIGIGIIGVASLAAVLSKNSDTTQVIQASGDAYSQGLATALSPITGGGSGTSYGGAGSAIGNFGMSFPIS